MKNFACHVATAALVAGAIPACSSPGEPQEPASQSRSAVQAQLTYPGYMHQLSRSKFPLVPEKDVSEFGFHKTVGPTGTFAVRASNGSVLAILNADASALSVGPLPVSAADHNARVRDYFVAAGIPREQIGSVSAHAEMLGTGDPVAPTQGAEFLGYTSVLNRVLEGIPIVDSTAVASFNKNGDVVYESVHWPSIPFSAIEDAKSIDAMLADSPRASAWRQKLPSSVREQHGTVVVRHTHSSSDAPFKAIAAWAVLDGQAARHFGIQGDELTLPGQEPARYVPHRYPQLP